MTGKLEKQYEGSGRQVKDFREMKWLRVGNMARKFGGDEKQTIVTIWECQDSYMAFFDGTD